MENFPNYPPAVQDAILNGPALTPPDGVVSDFDNPSNHNTEALVLAVVCISLALVAAFLRAYSRLFVSQNVHLEDCASIMFQCPATHLSCVNVCAYLNSG